MTWRDVPDSRRRPPRSTVLLLVAVADVVLATVAGAALWTGLTDDRDSRHFDRRADAPTSGDLAFVLPDVVPQDARDITVPARTVFSRLRRVQAARTRRAR